MIIEILEMKKFTEQKITEKSLPNVDSVLIHSVSDDFAFNYQNNRFAFKGSIKLMMNLQIHYEKTSNS